jgi:hypothetical protein
MPTDKQVSPAFSADVVIIGAVGIVNNARMPFTAEGADEPLRTAVRDGRLAATTDPPSALRRDMQ